MNYTKNLESKENIMNDNSAVVGVAFSNDVFYNYVIDDGDFEFTGMNIVELLQEQRNEFVADIIASQSHSQINGIYSDGVELCDYESSGLLNHSTYNAIYNLMDKDIGPVDYYYIYDFMNDVLVIKTPFTKTMALDYKNEEDVNYFLEYLNNCY
jgi:hypothetical protein